MLDLLHVLPSSFSNILVVCRTIFVRTFQPRLLKSKASFPKDNIAHATSKMMNKAIPYFLLW